ncbi:MAG: tRNA (adenosine(37)-N6)-threonylcarbamoyltransferase complex transferase subunit TsaD [Candidatus Paceibacterota bacterium]|jgi:N6-L-threonylcarbamoyladenine synthase
MIILAIETSCDESAISIVEAKGGLTKPAFSTLVHLVSSQIELHRQYGGVVPNLAKREHGKNLVPLLIEALNSSAKTPVKLADGLVTGQAKINKLEKILEREPELKTAFFADIINLPAPKIDAIAVTAGPGLEPALWVGINLARALGTLWNIPVVPTNHIEGHLISPLLNQTPVKLADGLATGQVKFPAIGTIISGGHTEIVLIKKWRNYEYLGRTRDDAVGEAFDKVARLLDLPYPGGPEISKLADQCRSTHQNFALQNLGGRELPRPMLHSGDFDFSFSGLKTAVLYLVKKLGDITAEQKAAIAKDFEDSAAEVVVAKTMAAAKKFKAKTIIVGGGVIANRAIRSAFEQATSKKTPVKLADGLATGQAKTAVKLADRLATGQEKYTLILPDQKLTGDNATMIAGAAYLTLASKAKITPLAKIKADGNLKLGK